MNILSLNFNDYVNVESGWGVSLFVAGCSRHCKGCFNPESWDFNAGTPITPLDLAKHISQNLNGRKKLSILGGDPLAPQNRPEVLEFLWDIKGLNPELYVYLWTGYTIEELIDEVNSGDWNLRQILQLTDCIIDGPFIEEQKDVSLMLRGSANQRILRRGVHYNV